MSASVELHGPAERERLHDLLQASFSEYCSTTEDEELKAELENQMGLVTSLLDVWVPVRGQPSLLGAHGLSGPRLPQLAPPPRDAEVTELEEEVSHTAKQIAAFRNSMHTQLMTELGSRLAAQRPDVDLLSDEQNVSTEPSTLESQGDCSLDALAEKLENAAAQCPSLRAQLEETLARLTRILGVVRNEAEQNNAGPTTVEKVLLAAQDDDTSAQKTEADGNGGAAVRRLLIQSLTN